MYQYTEELEVFGTTSADYIVSSNAITGTGTGGAVTNLDVLNYFEENNYNSKPNPDYTIPGHGKLAGADLSSVLAKKTWADVNAMKSAVLSDSYISTINTYASTAEYYLTIENKLQIKLFFDTETARNNWLNAVKARPSDQFKLAGVTVTTL
jgi:hypothetical protein